MFKYAVLLLIFLSLGNLSFCQDPMNYQMGNSGVINDDKFVRDYLENKYPGFNKANKKAIEKSKRFSNKSGQLYTVNLVVHVVWNDPAENLDDSIIYDQIRILNEDFQRLNPDSSNLRSIFQPIAGNPNIEFNLYHIERVQTSATFSLSFQGLPDHVKQTSQGGSDAWLTNYYLNIWICKIESPVGALLGWAYPPAGLSNWPAGQNAPSPELDGVVLDYRAIASNNPNSYPSGGGVINLVGRTATHEIGHYLGLRHIWGDGGGFFGGLSCSVDDGCADTPNQGYQTNFICDTTLNTCIDSISGLADTNDLPDLIENHMDYSEETCKNMFTLEQVVILRGVLENERIDLINPPLSNKNNILLNYISIYPNPANSVLNIITNVKMNQNKIIYILDATGRKVQENVFFSGKLHQDIDISNLKKGVYFLRIESMAAKSFVIQ